MKRRWKILIAVIVLVLLAAFLFFRPILILPNVIKSRIPMDYECPFPLEIKPPMEIPTEIVPGQVGLPDEHWGERRVVIKYEDLIAFGRFPRYRQTYHGDQLTEVVALLRRDLSPPWDNSFCPWRRWASFGFDSKFPPPPGFFEPRYDPIMIAAWLKETWDILPFWLHSLCLSWCPKAISRTTYRYDTEGRLVEKSEKYLPERSCFGEAFPRRYMDYDKPKTKAERLLYDENGTQIAHLYYEDNNFVRGWLKLRDTDKGITDEYSFSAKPPGLAVTWRRRPTTWEDRQRGLISWWADYGPDGRLLEGRNGVAGSATFPDWDRNMTSSVHFDMNGHITADEDGVAVYRDCWNPSQSWDAGANYGLDGRLVRSENAIILYRYDKRMRIRSWSHYNHRGMITHLYSFRPF